MNFKHSTPLALALTIACAAAGPPTAQADEGFGYDDPRSMQLNPSSLDVLPDGGILYVQDSKVSELTPSGEVKTLAGGGRDRLSLDPAPATSVNLDTPIKVAATDDGGFLIGNVFGKVSRVTPQGTIAIVAGNGDLGSDGDGGPATQAKLQTPAGIAQTNGNGFLVADALSARVREVTPDGIIHTLAGGGSGGDGGPATDAGLSFPFAVEPTADAGTLIGDIGGARVREVLPDGTITTVAGTGTAGFSGDGGPATSAQLSGSTGIGPSFDGPIDLAATADGGFLLVDSGNLRVRKVLSDGTITTVAGTGTRGYNGDGIPATEARIVPKDVALAGDGGFLVLDAARIRKVSASGVISTIAGMPADPFCHDAPYNGIQGTAKPDSLTGAELRDLIRGESRADVIEAGGDTDCVVGGSGSDQITGNGGADVITGGGGRDVIDGGDGGDRISGDGGSDSINGGKGNDRILARGKADPDRIKCGPGHDIVTADKLDRVAPSCEQVLINGR